METVIQLEHVHKAYPDHPVLRDFNLKILKEEFVTVIGSSGCGKTTLLKLMNGLIIPDSGKIYIDGKDISRENPSLLRRHIGYVIQGTGLFPHLNIRKNITYVPSLLKHHTKKQFQEMAGQLLTLVGLGPEMLNRYPAELSGGQRQRVGIARALAAHPEILLMDEPFGALDEITRKMLQAEITRIHLQLGVTIVFVTHDIREALSLGSRVLVMKDGQIEQDAPPEKIKQFPRTPFVEQLIR